LNGYESASQFRRESGVYLDNPNKGRSKSPCRLI
jgi:hypothetical protein